MNELSEQELVKELKLSEEELSKSRSQSSNELLFIREFHKLWARGLKGEAFLEELKRLEKSVCL